MAEPYRQLSTADGTLRVDMEAAAIGRYAVGDLLFDNDPVIGAGAVPAVRHISNYGVLVGMTPRTFLSLIPALDPLDRPGTFAHLDARARPLGTPFLDVGLTTATGELSVRQHEGTHRMIWISRNYGADFEIPVGLLLREDHYQLKGREIEQDLVERVSRGVIREKSREHVDGPLFSQAVWVGGSLEFTGGGATPSP